MPGKLCCQIREGNTGFKFQAYWLSSVGRISLIEHKTLSGQAGYSIQVTIAGSPESQQSWNRYWLSLIQQQTLLGIVLAL